MVDFRCSLPELSKNLSRRKLLLNRRVIMKSVQNHLLQINVELLPYTTHATEIHEYDVYRINNLIKPFTLYDFKIWTDLCE